MNDIIEAIRLLGCEFRARGLTEESAACHAVRLYLEEQQLKQEEDLADSDETPPSQLGNPGGMHE